MTRRTVDYQQVTLGAISLIRNEYDGEFVMVLDRRGKRKAGHFARSTSIPATVLERKLRELFSLYRPE